MKGIKNGPMLPDEHIAGEVPREFLFARWIETCSRRVAFISMMKVIQSTMSDKQNVGSGGKWLEDSLRMRNASLGSLSQSVPNPWSATTPRYGSSHDVPRGSSRCHFNGFVFTS